ncbi:MAG TPA: alkaline phosphatase family protein [Pirellulales bacterium]|jgi:YVTN family beta-propeller protein|nr:alkaline phosphatase family protein [Pirellulales bacterium]
MRPIREHRRRPVLCVLLAALAWSRSLAAADARSEVTVLEPPGAMLRPTIEGDPLVLVNGRLLTPAGHSVRTQSYSWGLAVSPDETTAVLVSRDAIEFIALDPLRAGERLVPFRTPGKRSTDDGMYMGCGFSPDGAKLYVGSANRGRVVVYDAKTRKLLGHIPVDGDGFADSFLGDFVVSRDGRRLYAVDQHNYRLVTVDLEAGKVTQSVRVGRNPFGICLSPDAKYAWVSNVGMFEYPLLPGVNEQNRATAGLEFPAYGVPSREAEVGVMVGGIWIPGLGSPNHPDAMSVFKVNLATGKVEAKIKTGYLVGAKRKNINTVGGASPSTVAVGSRFAYVSNATNDNISVIDISKNEIVTHIDLNVPGLEDARGVLPFGLALRPDESRLYVACAGLNAVAVVDTKSRQLAGYIPAGWFCAFVRTSHNGRELFVASAKGVGSGPNGGRGFVPPERGSHPGDIMQGLFQRVPVPDAKQLQGYTSQVVGNTYRARKVVDDGTNPLPPRPGLRASPIRHVVFIVKENRTFDQVYGERSGLVGDATLAGLGRNVTVKNKKLETVSGVNVTPNHQALADQFALCDNFYCDADQSNTGHRWVVGVYPNEWVEVNARSRIEARPFSSAPGRRYVNGSSATVMPEDYNEAGALWEHLDRHKIPFFNFGFGTEIPMSMEEQIHKNTGVQLSVSFPLPKPLFDRTSRKYPTFNMNIPDQYRADIFEEEYRERWASGNEPFPRLITMVLPNDHMSGERPEAGYPFAESYVADNDLALGRVVHLLSRTPYWKNMLIIVTEDDPQGGRDHVDAHRSILLLIGPHVKRNYVSSGLMNFGSILKMIFTLLDLPYLNQFDATASLPRDFFTDKPNLDPYTMLPVDARIFDPAAALKPFDHGFDWKSLLESPEMDDPDDMRAGFDDDDND